MYTQAWTLQGKQILRNASFAPPFVRQRARMLHNVTGGRNDLHPRVPQADVHVEHGFSQLVFAPFPKSKHWNVFRSSPGSKSVKPKRTCAASVDRLPAQLKKIQEIRMFTSSSADLWLRVNAGTFRSFFSFVFIFCLCCFLSIAMHHLTLPKQV